MEVDVEVVVIQPERHNKIAERYKKFFLIPYNMYKERG
jgi:hypothetical protein